MNVQGILPFTRTLLQSVCHEGEIAVDGTCGNGHDTLFLANLVGETGHVYGFDVQEQAIAVTTERLEAASLLKRVTLFQQGHHQLEHLLPADAKGRVACAVFNLGYLPGSDKAIVTKGETTILAVKQLLTYLKEGGIIVLVIYHGHEGGREEKEAVLQFARNLPQKEAHVLQYGFINQSNTPPFIVAIEKRG
ncbi:putative rRNA methylase [Fictibacillus macauensis ZFHKF-1]|uniref:Putative rRNA methylase n=1 Tax=Fictibacillus macauensis ZFHKF-1 TaxID=1196324 RepID=I8AII2_9BACL|nr:class I SAM-dependent methyltransferase [Fictibacillus macauensis]EIT85527.1 putative rRNA methylase [Fictibacillus macauensis ZFHKF-1]